MEIFNKKVRNDFIKYIQEFGFYFQKSDDKFVGFYDDIVFRLGFDVSSYGSRISFLFEYYFPLIEDKLDVFPEDMLHNDEITVFKWDMKLEGLKKKEKELQFESYIEDMKYIFSHYIYYINSAVVNDFDLERAILESYYNQYSHYLWEHDKEDGARKYRGDFVESGRSLEEYSDEDEKKALAAERTQREEEFPYPPVKEKILNNIGKHQEHFDVIKEAYTDHIKIEPSIHFIDDPDKFLYRSSYGDRIICCLEKYGYFHDQQHFFVERNIFRHREDENIRVRVVIDQRLFLRFDVFVKNTDPKVTKSGANFYRHVDAVYEPHSVAAYINTPFAIGWLLGNERKLDENIDMALEALEKKLQDNI